MGSKILVGFPRSKSHVQNPETVYASRSLTLKSRAEWLVTGVGKIPQVGSLSFCNTFWEESCVCAVLPLNGGLCLGERGEGSERERGLGPMVGAENPGAS